MSHDVFSAKKKARDARWGVAITLSPLLIVKNKKIRDWVQQRKKKKACEIDKIVIFFIIYNNVSPKQQRAREQPT